MNKTFAATVLACAGIFGLAASADARDWGHDRHHGRHDRHDYNNRYQNHQHFERRFVPAPRYYVPPPPRMQKYCTDTYYGSVRQNYDTYTGLWGPQRNSRLPCPY